MGRRFSVPDIKEDTLYATWGREYTRARPSIVYVYPDRDARCDARVLCDHLEGKRYERDPDIYGHFKLSDSLIEELDKRGWDLTTMKFSIKRKERSTQ